MKHLFEVANFVRRLRTQMRFGELSRSPLRLLRFTLQGESAECDWLTSPADVWDEMLPRQVRERHASMQAVHDAVAIRKMMFVLLSEVRTIELRAFRQSAREPPRLVISGAVIRQEAEVAKVTSPVMRAKLYGFRFWLDDGVLVTLQPEDRAVSNF
ncbi:MAG: hypothetical protein ACRD4E_04555 [Bryobacteraceae bacterium]